MNKTAIILLMCLLVFSSCTVIPDKQIDETAPGTVDYTVDGTEKPFTDASETDETPLLETEESVESETNVPKTDIPETEATETIAAWQPLGERKGSIRKCASAMTSRDLTGKSPTQEVPQESSISPSSNTPTPLAAEG